jgi:hypothetical protein
MGPRGVWAIRCRITTSRSDADFAEVEGEATDLIAAIDGWIALEPIIAEAQRTLAEAKTAPDKGGKHFINSKVCRDLSQLIIEAASYRPADLAEVDKKASHLQMQRAAVKQALAIWGVTIRVLKASGPLKDEVRRKIEELPASDALRTDLAAEPPRGIEAQASLSSSLDASLGELREIEAFLPSAAAAIPLHEQQAIAAAAQQAVSEAKTLTDEAQALTDEAQAPVVKPHDDASGGFQWRNPTQEDMVLSLVAGLGAAVFYAATIFSDTWGSVPEISSALAAGFVTPSLAQWAALPILRSFRWQRAAAAGTPAAADAAASQAPTKK